MLSEGVCGIAMACYLGSESQNVCLKELQKVACMDPWR